MRISFTDRELDVMAVLWERGSATVAEVRERLPDDLAYTTVLTVLRTLEEKGHVEHMIKRLGLDSEIEEVFSTSPILKELAS